MAISTSSIPLAERLRPTSLNDYRGQEHLVGTNGVIRRMIDSGNLSSIILWGPPGVGKTTLARIIATQVDATFFTLSAISSGVKDVREVIAKAKNNRMFSVNRPILFIDEIHRFSKSQQDSLLGAIEDGTITLIGATTENPSFEVISPLLSRCQVYVLQHLSEKDIETLFKDAVTKDVELKNVSFELKEKEALLQYAGGDARKLLNIADLLYKSAQTNKVKVTNKLVAELLQANPATYDKNGEMHYDIISAFIKSIRGSDPDAAVYWLARMVEGGEDPKFIARRIVISAAEDIGLANPNALLIANNCFDAIHKVGWPEGRIVLSMAAIYLANSPKSNSAYQAIKDAQLVVKQTGNKPVPLHLRNAPTKLMKDLDYGKNYKYAHSYENNFVEQDFLPADLLDEHFYKPQSNPLENKAKDFLSQRWGDRFNDL